MEERSLETVTLQQALSTTADEIKELRQENTSLRVQVNQPVSSTPFRPMAPSLHEELAGCGLVDEMSPVVDNSVDDVLSSLVNGNNDEFSDISHKLSESVSAFLF